MNGMDGMDEYINGMDGWIYELDGLMSGLFHVWLDGEMNECCVIGI
jgi:hypothetical protein